VTTFGCQRYGCQLVPERSGTVRRVWSRGAQRCAKGLAVACEGASGPAPWRASSLWHQQPCSGGSHESDRLLISSWVFPPK